MENRGQRVKRQGVVTSDAMDKTITVSIERQFSHPLYKRTVRRTKKFLAHDENSQAKVGDRVEIIEARPYSRLKRWKLVRIIESK